MSDRLTQKERIRMLLESRAGQWIPLPEILALHIAQFGARIKELRADGMDIENETEHFCECGHPRKQHNQRGCSYPIPAGTMIEQMMAVCECRRFRNATVKSRYRYTAQQKLFGDAA